MINAKSLKDGSYFVFFPNEKFKYRCEKIKGDWFYSDGSGWQSPMEYPEHIASVEEITDLPDLPELPELPKPPLGIMRRNIWELDRQLNILAAMTRYIEEGVQVPREWIAELKELNERNK